jgi:N-acetylglucosamine-6-phosphate deacetylase
MTVPSSPLVAARLPALALPHGAGPGSGRSLLITAGTVILPDRELSPGWVEVRGGRIVALGAGKPPRAADVSFPVEVLAPGFVDAHNHGGGGVSFHDADPRAAADRIVRTHRGLGTTTMMASLVTAPLDEMERLVRALAELVREGLLAGIHLEGPWLSPAQRGAHAEEWLRVPDAASVDRLMRAGDGAVRMVTIAPELAGGLDAVARIVGYGAVAARTTTSPGRPSRRGPAPEPTSSTPCVRSTTARRARPSRCSRTRRCSPNSWPTGCTCTPASCG